jgi:hypothetical protein
MLVGQISNINQVASRINRKLVRVSNRKERQQEKKRKEKKSKKRRKNKPRWGKNKWEEN